MNFKRIGRLLVCLVLICALLINVSPIRAKAVVVELTLAQWGLIAMATLLTAGITVNIVQDFELESLGSVFKSFMAESAKKQQLQEEILDITFGIVFVDDKPSKIPFGTDPDGFGWVLFGLLNFLELFSNLGEETITAKPPSFGTVSEGEIVSHGEYSFEVISSTSPVHYYIWCSPRLSENRHTTVFYSSKDFIITTSASVSFDVNSTTRNGVKVYYATCPLSWEGYSSHCSIHESSQTAEEVKGYVCSLLADSAPVSELSATIVDNTVQAALQGASVVDNISVPDIDLSAISSLSAIAGVNESLANGELSFEDLLNQLTGGETITVNPGGSVTDPDPGTGTNPDSGAGGESSDLNWLQRVGQWFSELRTSINELPNRFDEHFQNILSAIAAVPEAIIAGLRSLFQELFVPSEEYLNNKFQELTQKFPYLEPIISLGDTFKAYLSGVNPTPPVIWIDLGASQWHSLGGRVKFIDLTWYAQYKPTVDGILGAFLWLCLLWRLFQAAPGIVQGASGFFGNADPHPDGSFSGSNWIAGQRFLAGGFGKRNE